MGLTTGAIAMALFASFILYGGLIYFLIIAMGRDPIKLLPEPLRGILKVPNNRYALVLGISLMLIIPALASEGIEEEDPRYPGGGSGGRLEYYNYTDEIIGQLNEGAEADFAVSTGGYDVHAVFILTWDDEPPPPGHTNQGDTFRLEVSDPEGWEQDDEETNSPGNTGTIQLTFNVTEYHDDEYYDVEGDWQVTVTLMACGQNTVLGVADPLYPDNDNSYSLSIEMNYLLR
jgi:hypothetical protein